MLNPLTFLQELKNLYININTIKDLEFATVIDIVDNDLEEDLDIMGAVMTIIKNSTDVETDPVILSQVILGLNGIKVDFNEFEFPFSEQIYLFFYFLSKGKIILPELEIDKNNFSEEVKYFLATCLADENIYFLTEELKFLQKEVLDIYENTLGNKIKEEDLKICEERYQKYKNFEIENIPEDDEYDIQVKQNIFMQQYSFLKLNQ